MSLDRPHVSGPERGGLGGMPPHDERARNRRAEVSDVGDAAPGATYGAPLRRCRRRQSLGRVWKSSPQSVAGQEDGHMTNQRSYQGRPATALL